MLTMVSLGVGELVGSLLIGQIIDKLSSRAATVVNSIFVAIAMIISLIFIKVNEYNVLAFAMTFMWGVVDSVVQTHSF